MRIFFPSVEGLEGLRWNYGFGASKVCGAWLSWLRMADFNKPQDGVQDRDDDERQQQHQQQQQMLTEAKEQEKPCKETRETKLPSQCTVFACGTQAASKPPSAASFAKAAENCGVWSAREVLASLLQFGLPKSSMNHSWTHGLHTQSSYEKSNTSGRLDPSDLSRLPRTPGCWGPARRSASR